MNKKILSRILAIVLMLGIMVSFGKALAFNEAGMSIDVPSSYKDMGDRTWMKGYTSSFNIQIEDNKKGEAATKKSLDDSVEELKKLNLGKSFVNAKNEKPYASYTVTNIKSYGLEMLTFQEFVERYYSKRADAFYLVDIQEVGNAEREAVDKAIEILVNYEPKMHYFTEWWKQLYGESEGKDGKGIYVASASFSTDLHSLGQMIQDGERNIFETVLQIATPVNEQVIPFDEANLDGLNFLAGKTMDYVNKQAFLGTLLAHVDGGVPNIVIEFPEVSAYAYGYLAYFFEFACGVSAYTLGVNPFNQPGVEAYKKNMFALLGKPGYEELAKELANKLNK